MSKLSELLISHITPDTIAATAMSNLIGAFSEYLASEDIVYEGYFTGVIDATGVPVAGKTKNRIFPGTLDEVFLGSIESLKSSFPENTYITFDQVFDILYNSIKTTCMIGAGDIISVPTLAFPELKRITLQQEVLRAAAVAEQEKIQEIVNNSSLENSIKRSKISEIGSGIQGKVMDALATAFLTDLTSGAVKTVPGKYLAATGTTTGSVTCL